MVLKARQAVAPQVVEKVVAEQARLFLGICVELVAKTVRARWHHARLEDYGDDDDNQDKQKPD